MQQSQQKANFNHYKNTLIKNKPFINRNSVKNLWKKMIDMIELFLPFTRYMRFKICKESLLLSFQSFRYRELRNIDCALKKAYRPDIRFAISFRQCTSVLARGGWGSSIAAQEMHKMKADAHKIWSLSSLKRPTLSYFLYSKFARFCYILARLDFQRTLSRPVLCSKFVKFAPQKKAGFSKGLQKMHRFGSIA